MVGTYVVYLGRSLTAESAVNIGTTNETSRRSKHSVPSFCWLIKMDRNCTFTIVQIWNNAHFISIGAQWLCSEVYVDTEVCWYCTMDQRPQTQLFPITFRSNYKGRNCLNHHNITLNTKTACAISHQCMLNFVKCY